LREFLWPMLERPTRAEADKMASALAADLDDIKTQTWSKEPATVLSEARRLIDAEVERRRHTDVKAATYLTVVGVLTTILVTLVPAIFNSKTILLLQLASGALLVLTVSYLTAGGIWAFWAMRVSDAVQVGASDLVRRWATSEASSGLTTDLLLSVRRNYELGNMKLNYLKMAEAFLVRAFVAVAIMLVVQVLGLGIVAVVQSLSPAPNVPMALSAYRKFHPATPTGVAAVTQNLRPTPNAEMPAFTDPNYRPSTSRDVAAVTPSLSPDTDSVALLSGYRNFHLPAPATDVLSLEKVLGASDDLLGAWPAINAPSHNSCECRTQSAPAPKLRSKRPSQVRATETLPVSIPPAAAPRQGCSVAAAARPKR
jgi:hypothetical protein